jgi:hypothetical protein
MVPLAMNQTQNMVAHISRPFPVCVFVFRPFGFAEFENYSQGEAVKYLVYQVARRLLGTSPLESFPGYANHLLPYTVRLLCARLKGYGGDCVCKASIGSEGYFQALKQQLQQVFSVIIICF